MTKPAEEKLNSDKKSPILLELKKTEEYLKKIENWELSSDKKRISRSFNFESFREAIDFINKVAVSAEKTKHYPDVMIIRFKKVVIELATRDIEGLSENDFILAEKIDAIAGWEKKWEQLLTSPAVLVLLIIIFFLALFWRYFR